jgi:NCS1 family nucleobase:cation symporter-1
VLARASFGVLGANVAAVLRALVACGWFGIQTWIGGEAINVLLATCGGMESGAARSGHMFYGILAD